MKVTVKVHLILTKYQINLTNNQNTNIELSEKSLVKDLIKSINIPIEEIGMVLVNGTIVKNDHILKENDIIQIYPPIIGG